MVAAMTESELRMERVKEPPTLRLVDRDSAPRRARRLVVQFDVGELFNVRSRDHDSRSEQQHLEQPACGGLGTAIRVSEHCLSGNSFAGVGNTTLTRSSV
jgi:hypothetical protein